MADRQTDAVQCHRTFVDDVANRLPGTREPYPPIALLRRDGYDLRLGIDMPLDNVPAHAVRGPKRTLQIHRRIRGQLAKCRADKRFFQHVCVKTIAVNLRYRQATPLHGNALSLLKRFLPRLDAPNLNDAPHAAMANAS